MRWILSPVWLAILTSAAFAAEQTYTLTGNNTRIEWTGTKPDGKHDGGFKKLSGTAVAGAKGELKLELEIDQTSLYSDNILLTAHLKSPDFFAVKDHPKSRFVSRKVEKADKGFVIIGDLTLLGKTREVRIPAEISVGEVFTLEGRFTINRHDFGMSYAKGKINDEVQVRVKVQAKK
jgi:polyisoprenoid-binding protein YceI